MNEYEDNEISQVSETVQNFWADENGADTPDYEPREPAEQKHTIQINRLDFNDDKPEISTIKSNGKTLKCVFLWVGDKIRGSFFIDLATRNQAFRISDEIIRPYPCGE